MKAYVLHDINDIRFEEVDKPVPACDEALVKIQAAGICGSDIPRIFKTGAHVHPIIPGHEFSGIVESVGDDSANSDLIGKRVGVFPLIPCKKCPQCMQKKYEMCENYNYLGSRCDGGFAEYVSVPLWNLIELPDEVSFEQAAMLEPFCVAAHSVRGIFEGTRGRFSGSFAHESAPSFPYFSMVSPEAGEPSPGPLASSGILDERILVWGLGTIGIMIVQILKAEGFSNIFCAVNKASQKDILTRELDIPIENIFYGNHSHEGISGLSDFAEGSFDVVFECVGKEETLQAVVNAAAPSGSIMLVGNPYGDMELPRDLYWKILRNQLTIKGTWNSSYRLEENDDWNYIIRLMKENKLNTDILITHKFSLEELNKGLEIMRGKSESYIKCMIT